MQIKFDSRIVRHLGHYPGETALIRYDKTMPHGKRYSVKSETANGYIWSTARDANEAREHYNQINARYKLNSKGYEIQPYGTRHEVDPFIVYLTAESLGEKYDYCAVVRPDGQIVDTDNGLKSGLDGARGYAYQIYHYTKGNATPPRNLTQLRFFASLKRQTKRSREKEDAIYELEAMMAAVFGDPLVNDL